MLRNRDKIPATSRHCSGSGTEGGPGQKKYQIISIGSCPTPLVRALLQEKPQQARDQVENRENL